VRTILLSDLHLGARSGSDLLRRAEYAELLAGEVDGADEIVLLGDVLELRDRPLADVLEIARPFFETLGEALGDGRIIVVPGNHDHQLLNPWLERRRLSGARPLGHEQIAKANAGALGSLARRTGKAEVVLAYPGIRLTDGVYATHGHYLDCHVTVPTFERLGVGALERLLGGLPAGGRSPDDYESVQAPLYSLLYGLAQGGERTARLSGANASARVWSAVYGRGASPPTRRSRLTGRFAVPGAVRLARGLGIGPLNADLSVAEIGRAGVRAMREVVRRLGIEAEHVIFGHTHRRGPVGAEPGWSQHGEPQLHNLGSWVYAPRILGRSAADSPFWPGTIGVLEDGGPPRIRPLLDDHTHADLKRRR
jgi:predicted phosphodiesterase